MYIVAEVPSAVNLDGRFPGFTAVHRRGITYVVSPQLGTFEEKPNADRIRYLAGVLRDHLKGMSPYVQMALQTDRHYAFAESA